MADETKPPTTPAPPVPPAGQRAVRAAPRVAPAPPAPPKPAAPPPPAVNLSGKTTTAAATAAKVSTRDPDDTSPLVSRRVWLGLAWGSFTAASVAALSATRRLMFAKTLDEAS